MMVSIDERKHIAERFVIHFFSSGGVMLAAMLTLHALARHWAMLPYETDPQILLCAIVVFAAAAVREAYDMKNGQSLTKAIWDYSSWATGCAFSAWALVRLI